MPVERSPQTDNFTQIPNSILRDASLKPQAKGVLCYMLSMPPDWNFSYDNLETALRIGRSALHTSVCALQEAGYVRILTQKKNGKCAGSVWYVSDTPYVQNPHTEKPHVEKPHVEKPHVENAHTYKDYSNKDYSNKDYSNQNCSAQSVGWDCSAGFDLFWEQYPKKTAKIEACAEWKKVCVDQSTQDQILEGLKRWLNSKQWEKENGRYIQRADKWLMDQRWHEHPEEKIPTGATGQLGAAELEAIQRLLKEE